MKPLFIPLKTEYYEAFRDGNKSTEYRVYGPRWNEKTCPEGREVVLSRGYGRSNRLNGKIVQFDRVPAKSLNGLMRIAIRNIYGTLEMDMACITISIDNPQSTAIE